VRVGREVRQELVEAEGLEGLAVLEGLEAR
jgi:hypothetical protein